ncbi:MAG: TIGR02757 family protein [Chitinophagaceae bacterium]
MKNKLRDFFDQKVAQYNQPAFIAQDPICIPHLFKKRPDIEIAGFFAAIFAWGNRTIIINKCKDLLQRMDMAPQDFVMNHQPSDLKRLLDFKHRTFADADILYFIDFFHQHYRQYDSLETAFTKHFSKNDLHIGPALDQFKQYFFSYEHLGRTEKHISSPKQNSTCKRLNMFLRWMVRQDNNGVDFGMWKTIKPSQLICPIDVHVARVAQRFNLLERKQTDWQAAVELTGYLKTLDAADPVKYDFALFGLGVMEPRFIKFEMI